MELLRTPKGKIIAAAALLAALVAAGSLGGIGATSIARWVLVAGAAVAIALWMRRVKGQSGEPQLARLRVVSRAGLSQRCGVALLEADGSTYLVVHGDGYAEVAQAPSFKVKARRPRIPRRASRGIRKGGTR
ncbi:MAG: hypothetical protein HYZ28_15860 [Myxococcales bacterium]|nr:hypothetical protein [Myxococcales bacterium]